MTYNLQSNENYQSSYKTVNTKLGIFNAKIISIKHQPGKKYCSYWRDQMQEIMLENGDVYITYGTTQWCKNNLNKTIQVRTTSSTALGWRWIHLASNCDCCNRGSRYSF